MKRYRFLLFDADYTLLDFDKDMFHAFQATYEACFGLSLIHISEPTRH